ncbi:hypothetical protein [Anaeromyxobacter diazotrophicus]|uniref:Uncharacterized protein n=1 Tax=Anaeromyxobacter diazotrophicus TaxID=2590199 RepID=A0A7I9VS52_9BACT|nr:hypothetical protein [Anaeromyxobacter diazotrophicus]GEJ59272.1 hypothetical protein AMYX_40130 [Anaeromyxobacter diazotrophicus]
MLRRSFAALVLCALAGCQDYNFNPVGKCVIQPGSSRIKLSSLAVADILFVVDDSGSMSSEQASMARNFGSFVSALAQAQKDRQAAGLDPFDFHVAITTSSVFEGWTPYQATTCGGTPLQCAISDSHYTRTASSEVCTEAGATCEDLVENFFPSFSVAGCTGGVASPGATYPHGNFVAAAGNPSVLHFTKDIWDTTSSTAAAKLDLLTKQFQANIAVGTCGSGMEQHFEAGRLAVEKALAGKQPGVTADEWPHAGAKLVVVWLGDEDDCSNPDDPTHALAFDPNNFGSSTPGSDVCVNDQRAATHKMYALDRYVSYFTSLNRSFGAAFIYSADQKTCVDDGNGNRVCKAGTCTCDCPASCLASGGCGPGKTGECNVPSDCSGKIPFLSDAPADVVGTTPYGSRYATFSGLLRRQGVSTFEASVCDANWGATLQGIAQLVKPPPGLTLPTQPAATEVALLRVESADGKSSRYCTGPALTQADLATFDWWFVDCKTGQPVLGGSTSNCININHATKHCEAGAGESYIAQYLGVVPSPTPANPLGGCDPTKVLAGGASTDCQASMGGAATDWQCTPIGTSGRGTCTCASAQ